ncbi:hypothetical protein [Streptosporangium sp. NPDC050280]|uniref:hypothetical protein n=1 Tax=unclassified Streptosporangium TaxID=2632669 RepID=UPI0034242394
MPASPTDRTALGRDYCISRATAATSTRSSTSWASRHQAIDIGLTYLILDGTVIATDRCAEKITSIKGEPIDL